jgi:hypothetical protein
VGEEAVSNRNRPSIVLHIGQHKTGSKALQSFLAHNRNVLRNHGICYPGGEDPSPLIPAYANSHFPLFALIRREALAACAGAAAAQEYWQRVRSHCRGFDSARALFESFEAAWLRAGATQVILSAEDCFDMQTAHDLEFSPALVAAAAGRLAALAAGAGGDVRVAVYLRRQDHLLAAHYVQFIKGSSVHDLDFAAFARAFAPRLDTRRILAAWARAFGAECLRVRPYERAAMPTGIVADFFDHVLGRPVPAECTRPPADVESVNRTIDRDWVEYIRTLNRRAVRGEPVPPRAAVLEGAFRATCESALPSGVAAWLSPADRRDLIAAHSAGNGAIARDFLDRHDGRLFAEPPPAEDARWSPYRGLAPERALAIARAVDALLPPSIMNGQLPSRSERLT